MKDAVHGAFPGIIRFSCRLDESRPRWRSQPRASSGSPSTEKCNAGNHATSNSETTHGCHSPDHGAQTSNLERAPAVLMSRILSKDALYRVEHATNAPVASSAVTSSSSAAVSCHWSMVQLLRVQHQQVSIRRSNSELQPYRSMTSSSYRNNTQGISRRSKARFCGGFGGYSH